MAPKVGLKKTVMYGKILKPFSISPRGPADSAVAPDFAEATSGKEALADR